MCEFSDSQPTVQTLSTSSCPTSLPPLLQPKGLDAKRKIYLFREIREFCKEEFKDIVCPDPVNIEELDTSAAASESDIDATAGTSARPAAQTKISESVRPTSKSATGRRSRGRGGRASKGRGRQTNRKPQQTEGDADSDDDAVISAKSARQAKPDSSDSDDDLGEQVGRSGRGRPPSRRRRTVPVKYR